MSIPVCEVPPNPKTPKLSSRKTMVLGDNDDMATLKQSLSVSSQSASMRSSRKSKSLRSESFSKAQTSRSMALQNSCEQSQLVHKSETSVRSQTSLRSQRSVRSKSLPIAQTSRRSQQSVISQVSVASRASLRSHSSLKSQVSLRSHLSLKAIASLKSQTSRRSRSSAASTKILLTPDSNEINLKAGNENENISDDEDDDDFDPIFERNHIIFDDGDDGDDDDDDKSTNMKMSTQTANDEHDMSNDDDNDDNIGTNNDAMKGPAPIEIIISFDTTGSMSHVLDEVKAKVQEIIQRLFMDIPNMKIGVIAHGDYCDEEVFYLMQKVDFTNDVANLCQFVKDVTGTGGGDFPECYEWVLSQVRQLQWTPGTRRSLIMIGDAIPHEAKDPQNKLNLDWRQEADALYGELGVRVYAVQCANNAGAEDFWKNLAHRTYGRHLKLDQFSTIVDILMAICYREHGAEYFEAFEREVRNRTSAHLPKDLDTAFDVIRGGPGTSKSEDVPPAKGFNFSINKQRKKVNNSRSTGQKGAAKAVNIAAKKMVKKSVKTNLEKKVKSKKTAAALKLSGTKKLRELVPNTKFLLNCLPWSPWKLAMCATAPNDKDCWQERRNGNIGVRNVSLFKNTCSKMAVYEFAVQHQHQQKKYVMYSKTTAGFTGVHWDTYLLRCDGVQKEIDNVLKQGCKLYARRAFVVKKCYKINGQKLDSAKTFAAFLKRTYDYAWKFAKRNGKGKEGGEKEAAMTSHRQVYSRQGIEMSTAGKKCTCVMCS